MEVKQWVVVASRNQAKIFKRTDSNKPLKWIQNLENQTVAQKDQFLPPEEVTTERFVKVIVDALKFGSDHQAFNKVFIFAEPHLLGVIKQNIPKCMKEIEFEFIPKDLEKATSEELTLRVS